MDENKYIQFDLPYSEYEHLLVIAKREEGTIKAYLRKLIREQIKKEKEKNQWQEKIDYQEWKMKS